MHLRVLSALTVLLSVTGLAPILNQDNADVIAGEYIVKLRSGANAQMHQQSMNSQWKKMSASASVMRQFSIGGGDAEGVDAPFQAYAATLSDEALQALQEDPNVEFIEPNFVVKAYDARIQEGASISLGLRRICRREPSPVTQYVWDDDDAGEGVDIYIVDSGIRTTHVDFEGRAIFGANFASDNRQEDSNGHGTHVAGIAGGTNYGVARKSTLIAVRVLDRYGMGSSADTISGLNWVVSNAQQRGRPYVINMSLGVDAIARSLDQAGAIIVVAAGNKAMDACSTSPANVAAAITVGSTGIVNNADALSSFSNYGSCVDILAPGKSIISAYHLSDTNEMPKDGTSMAAPFVAGVIANMLGKNPTMTPVQARARLLQLATPTRIQNLPAGTTNLLLYSDPPPLCAPRYFSENKQCVECTAGFFCSGGYAPKLNCPNHSTSQPRSATASDCQCILGAYKDGGECKSCPRGFYCANPMLAPVKCSDRRWTVAEGANSQEQCVCAPGFVENTNGQCVACDENFYCPGVSPWRVQCRRNSKSPDQSSAPENCTCVDGYFSATTDRCDHCPVGPYCADGTKKICTDNAATTKIGANSPADCLCTAGFFMADGVCKQCNVGSFCPGNGSPMQACPDGSSSLNSRAKTDKDCQCVAGFIGDGGNTCMLSAASYALKFTVGASCPEGFFCGVNTKPNGAEQCPEDHYCPAKSKAPLACNDMFTDAFNPLRGSSSIDHCICEDGMFKDNKTQSCDLCPLHSVCKDGIATACGQFGQTARTGSSMFTQCYCAPGYFGDGRNCTECGRGNFCGTGAVKPTKCDEKRTTISKTARSRIDCVCSPGFELTSTCTACKDGTFKPEAGNVACRGLEPLTAAALNSAAWECAPNAFLNNGTKKCVPCPDHTAKLTPGNETCTACDKFDLKTCSCFDTTSPTAVMCRRCGQFLCSAPFWATVSVAGIVLIGGAIGYKIYRRRKQGPTPREASSSQSLHRSGSSMAASSPGLHRPPPPPQPSLNRHLQAIRPLPSAQSLNRSNDSLNGPLAYSPGKSRSPPSHATPVVSPRKAPRNPPRAAANWDTNVSP